MASLSLWDEVCGRGSSGSADSSTQVPDDDRPRQPWPGFGATFSARDILHLQGRRVCVTEDYQGVRKGTDGEIGDGRKTASGWLLEVRWTSGSERNRVDWLVRTEVERHLKLLVY